MRFLFTWLCLLVPIFSFTIIPSRPMANLGFWVDNRFSTKQLKMINEAVALWASNNGNRMSVSVVTRINNVINGDQIPTVVPGNSTMAGSTVLVSQFGDDLLFHLYDADITLNTDVLGDTDQFYNAFLHELGHAQCLYHNAIKDSVMNVSIILDGKTGKAAPDVKRVGLHLVDTYAAYASRHATKYEMLKPSNVHHVEYRP